MRLGGNVVVQHQPASRFMVPERGIGRWRARARAQSTYALLTVEGSSADKLKLKDKRKRKIFGFNISTFGENIMDVAVPTTSTYIQPASRCHRVLIQEKARCCLLSWCARNALLYMQCVMRFATCLHAGHSARALARAKSFLLNSPGNFLMMETDDDDGAAT